jgi:hypothetical protein
MQLTIPNTFANGTGEANIIDAPKMNANFDAVVTVLNGNIEADNIKTNSAIAIKNIVQTISAIWTFSANPVFNTGAIADAALSSNIPKKDSANTFAGKQTFGAKIDMSKTEIEQPVLHKLASAPGSPVAGQMYYNTATGHPYIWDGSAWQQMDYVGAYSGGAVRSYSDFGTCDDNDSYKLWFKTEGASPTVKIAIKGHGFPLRFYTELGSHTHVFTGTSHDHGVTESNHKHDVNLGSHTHTGNYSLSTHTHTVGSTGSAGGSHDHDGVATGAYTTSSENINHTHTVPTTSTGSTSQSIPNTAITGDTENAKTNLTVNNTVAGGTNAATGVSAGTISSVQKRWPYHLTVQIDGTNVTSSILTATGWSYIGDNTDTHAFVTAGTGEMNASAWKTYTAGYHTLEIITPDTGYGCSFQVHIETS